MKSEAKTAAIKKDLSFIMSVNSNFAEIKVSTEN